MLSLIIAIVFGLVITYFALQNSANLAVHFGNYTITGVPLYIIVVIAILSGVLIAWLISSLNSLSAYLALRGKDKTIKESKKTITQLKKELYDLEIENAQLKSNPEPIEVIREEKSIPEKTQKPHYVGDLLRPAHNS